VGYVKDVHQVQRDRLKLTYPCYQVNARFDGGMSGGPVLDDDGKLCGVICSTYPPFSEDEEHASYVATLWPAMAISMNIDVKTGQRQPEYYPLLKLVELNVINATQTERVVLTKGDENIRYGIQFKKK